MPPKSVEDQILEACRKYPDGASDAQLSAELPALSVQARSDALNKLTKLLRIKICTLQGMLVYQERTADEAAKFKGLTKEDHLLYQIIKSSGTSGMWTKDMKNKTNLAQPTITKILKTLETRAMIKSVKNVNNPSRKLYMLAELQPSRELTGGAWYTENQFDAEFIEVLREACYKFIERYPDSSLGAISSFIKEKGFSKVELRPDDVHSVLNTLVYDGRIDVVDLMEETGEVYRPVVLKVPETTALTNMPCGVCPVFNECADGGLVSPQTCVYYQKWLEF